ncbi:NAD(P)-binding protein [Hypoxylon trugodes]|uniref:NAD(P)-binding protein n=1 Tax=Hypoxylon trugodes TaxID=326681 RepID=UPI002197E5C4|nr:NAD(P)-binding protein [Hypoxylon trugodes]KAI1385185.1 NAD(P)-binding protein [Hypoxylon trugodes]
MTTIKNVAVVGATGKIGRPIVDHLLASKLFNVTVLTRNGSQDRGFPANVSVKEVNYDSIESLESALRGQDALVSAMAFEAIHMQKNLVDAAFQAGVKRMIPSEYGNDLLNPKLAAFPIYQPKIAIREQCEQKVKENPSFSWTTIHNASFLGPDWTLDFIVDVKERKADIKDGGDVLFCATTYDDIAQAVIGILTHPEETANRPVRISSVNTTQNELIAIAKELGATDGWNLTYSQTENLESEAFRRWSEGDHSEEVIAMFINRAFIGKGWGGYFPVRDNDLLGIKGLGRDELKAIIKLAIDR